MEKVHGMGFPGPRLLPPAIIIYNPARLGTIQQKLLGFRLIQNTDGHISPIGGYSQYTSTDASTISNRTHIKVRGPVAVNPYCVISLRAGKFY